MFSSLGNLVKAAASVAVTPVTAVADTLTLGGLLVDREESFTEATLKSAAKSLGKAVDSE